MSTASSKSLVVLCASTLLAAVNWFDFHWNYEIGLLVLYALPLAWIAWSVGLGWSLVLCAASDAIRAWMDGAYVHRYAFAWMPWERGAMRLIVLGFVAYSFSVFRRDLDARSRRVTQLQGILPICIACNRISGSDGTWTDLETYIRSHSEATPQPRLCPDCVGLGQR